MPILPSPPPDANDRDRAWAAYHEANEDVRHFNGLQNHYRTMASTWLLAALGGVGFLYSTDIALPAGPDVLAGFISLAAALGITLLWIIDVLVYHELLIASEEVARQLECQHAWLPQTRHTFRLLHKRRRAVRLKISWFYIGSIVLLTTVGAFALAIAAAPRYNQPVVISIFGGISAAGVALVGAMYRDAIRRHRARQIFPKCDRERD